VNRRERNRLCERVVGQLSLPAAATHRDACHRVGELMSELLDARVELRFIVMRNTCLSGATARCPDGGYLVYCATSRSWYHRLGILLHEYAHLLLGHQPTALNAPEGLRRFAPHVPDRMAHLLLGRTIHTEDEEREAEELADELLERLTERQARDELDPNAITPHVLRVAEGLGRHHGWTDLDDR
jgi:hypothetical protein